MEDLHASMRSLTGMEVLPILASSLPATPPPLGRKRPQSSASVAEQLSTLKTLQQEGAQVLASHQASPHFTHHLTTGDVAFATSCLGYIFCVVMTPLLHCRNLPDTYP